MLAVVVGIAATLVLSLMTAINCLDGDGGYPYVARDSSQADVCGATGNGLGLLVASGLAIGLFTYLARRRLRTAATQASGRLLPIALLVLIVAAPFALMALYNAPADTCSADQAAASDADCGHY